MPAPTLTSVTPTSGLSVGDVFVELAGTGFYLAAAGSVAVTFNGVPAVYVAVISATRVQAVAPPGDPDAGSPAGAVDVVATNLDLNGVPQGSATLVKGFTYKRPVIALPSDLSRHSIVALVTRTLVSELRRVVLKNSWSDMHPEYADDASAAAGETKRAAAPSLKVVGPRITEDRRYSRNEGQSVDMGGGAWIETFKSKTFMLTYDLVGIGTDPFEAANLWKECQRWFAHNDSLKVHVTSSALGVEDAVFELEASWTLAGEFRGKQTRQGLSQFTEQFVVRGVAVTPDEKFSESKEVSAVALSFYQKPEDSPLPADNVPVETLEIVLPSGADLQTTLADFERRIDRIEETAVFRVETAFNFASSTPVIFDSLAPGDEVLEAGVIVVSAFNDPAATIALGFASSPGAILSSSQIDPTVTGNYRSDPQVVVSSPDQFRLDVVRGTSNQGAGRVVLLVRRAD